MLFNSLHFAIFFPIVVAVYFALPYRYRWAWLLAAGYYFYMAWIPVYVLLLITSTLVDYTVARLIDRAEAPLKRRRLLYLSLATNLGMLFFFKYFNFFSNSVESVFNYLSLPYHTPQSKWLLPIGISFYTFQELGYTIDVYRGKIRAERHLGIFAVYVSFFPQLLAGPIERAGHLLPQLRQKFDFDYDRVTDGLKLMAWGLFKKVVIADRVAVLVEYVYAHPQNHTGPGIVLASFLFAWQVYCDFSGYSDIAVGAARVMGFSLMTNFERPYLSRSMPEVWRRWHISLTTWFRDYLFFPLGGSKGSAPRTCFNITLVFLLCGLWHGAQWTFAIWGLTNGLVLAFSFVTRDVRRNAAQALGMDRHPVIYAVWQHTFTLIEFSMLLVFFRVKSFSEALYILKHYFMGWIDPLRGLSFDNFILSLGARRVEDFYVAAVGIIILIAAQISQERHGPIRPRLAQRPVWLRWSLYYALVLVILGYGVFNDSPFIYFQF